MRAAFDLLVYDPQYDSLKEQNAIIAYPYPVSINEAIAGIERYCVLTNMIAVIVGCSLHPLDDSMFAPSKLDS